MDSMIKKWKKLINNDKPNKNNDENNNDNYDEIDDDRRNSNTNRFTNKKSLKTNSERCSDNQKENNNNPESKFKNSIVDYKPENIRTNKFKNSFCSSTNNISNNPNASFLSLNIQNHNNSKSLSQSANKKRDSLSKSKDKNSINKKIERDPNQSKSPSDSKAFKKNTNNDLENKKDVLNSLNSDKILKILYKLFNSLPNSSLETLDIKNFSEDLNEVINLYISKLNGIKEAKNANEQKDLILQTKCSTAERMIKEYEIKYLTAEKEKVILFKKTL